MPASVTSSDPLSSTSRVRTRTIVPVPPVPGGRLPAVGANLDMNVVRFVPMDALTIQQAAETTGWSPRMLRYIEQAGLVTPVRSEVGYRIYRAEHLQRLRTLRELLDQFDIGLAEVGFAARLRSDRDLQRTLDAWFVSTPSRPADIPADAWLQWEQHKHASLLAAGARAGTRTQTAPST